MWRIGFDRAIRAPVKKVSKSSKDRLLSQEWYLAIWAFPCSQMEDLGSGCASESVTGDHLLGKNFVLIWTQAKSVRF